MPKLGITSALYYRSSGNFGTPTWTALTDIGDLAVNAQWDVAEANTRASRIKSESKTLLGLEVTGRLKSQDASASYNAVVEAFLSGTSNIDILVLDGTNTTNGSRGFRFEAVVTQANQDQALTNALFLDLRFAPDGFSSNNFQSALVTAGAAAFTNM
jgi:hypothetical protein